MSGVRQRDNGGDPTAVLGVAVGAAVAGVVIAILLLGVGVASGPGLVVGAAVAVLATVGYTRLRALVAGDLALAVVGSAVFYVVLLPMLLAVQALLGGVVHD